ncbi:arginase family protein [Geodermatophilus sp. SYSU D00525]
MTGSPARPPVHLLRVPFDSGHEELRMGAGPTALARGGAADRLRGRGHVVTERVVRPDGGWRAEVATAFELSRVVAGAVAAAWVSGAVPVLLSGNCGTTLGVLAGLTATGRRLGLVWLDAHGDFDTPRGGPPAASSTGRAWRSWSAAAGARSPRASRGSRPWPRATSSWPAPATSPRRSRPSCGRRASPGSRRRGCATARRSTPPWPALAARVDAVHPHVDLDVYDPSIAPANGYAAPDGLGAGEVLDLVARAASRLPVVSLTLASYDPALDPAGRLRATALALLEEVCARATPLPS